MIDFIKNLKQKFQIEFLESDILIEEKNTYRTDTEGNIISLYLEEVSLNDLSVLLPISKYLKALYLIDCEIEKIDGISHFTQLEELSLALNPISNFKEIGLLHNLKLLNLTCVGINHLTDLEQLNKLEVLYLSNNRIDNINNICILSSLQSIKCRCL